MAIAKKAPAPKVEEPKVEEPVKAKSMKMAFDYSYIGNFSGAERIVTIPAGEILTGEKLAKVMISRPDWLINVQDDMPEVTDEGVILDLRLTADEKPSKPKDEDPDDPDKKKKL